MGKKLTGKLLVFIFLIFPLTALSHPGKTDIRDGHKCRKNCGEWGLDSAEYHLHDKHRNPIRLNKDGKPIADQPVEVIQPREQAPSEVAKQQDSPVQVQVEKAPDQTAAVNADVPAPPGKSAFPFYLLVVAFIVLCLLLLLILICRKKKNGR